MKALNFLPPPPNKNIMPKKDIEFEIDMAPPSINSFYGHHGNRKYITAKGREFKEYVEGYLAVLVKNGELQSFGDARIRIEYEFHFKGKRKRDTENYMKCMTDCFTGILFTDDEAVDEIEARRYYGAEYSKVVVRIMEL